MEWLITLMEEEAMYAYDFEGIRYDVGDKLGFLKATVEYALRKEELRDGFIQYLQTIFLIKMKEVIASSEFIRRLNKFIIKFA